MHRMERLTITGLAVLLALLTTAAPARGAGADALAELDLLVRQWMSARSAIAAETRAWQEQASAWRYELDLLERERATLQEHLDQHAAALRETAAAFDVQESDREQLRAGLDGLRPTVTAMEAHLLSLQPLIPAGVAPELADSLAALAADQGDLQTDTVVRRIQRALGLLADVERFQNGIHTGREMVVLGDSRRELEVLYLGLGQAYGVARDDSRAAIARPGPGGWHWEANDRIAPDVRAAIAILNRERPARLVTLPLQVEVQP